MITYNNIIGNTYSIMIGNINYNYMNNVTIIMIIVIMIIISYYSNSNILD